MEQETEQRIKALEDENNHLKEELEFLKKTHCAHSKNCELISPEKSYIHWDILDSVPDIIFFKDKEFNYLGGNQNYQEFIGKSLKELVGKNDYDFHTESEADILRAHDARIMQERKTDITTDWVKSAAGESVYLQTQKSPLLDREGNLYGLIGVAKNVTSSQDLENKLQITNEKLNEAQKIAKIGHWVWDLTTENLWWSDEIYRIFGYEPQEFGATYEAFLNTIHPEDRDTVNHATMYALEHKSKYNVFHRIVLPDGSEKIVHEVGEGSYDSNGNPVQMIGTVQDVTEIKRIEQALEESVRSYKELSEQLDEKVKQQTLQLVDQSRLAQMGEMISMIAHQWRQPLASITAAVNAIKIKVSLGKYDLSLKEDREKFFEFLQTRLDNIDNFALSLSTTIDDFRNFYKPNKEKTIVSIDVPLTKSLAIVRSMFNTSNITLINQLHATKEIPLYDNELMQVILNLLKNAEDNFIEKNIENRTVTIRSGDTQVGIVLEICDNGGGISDEIASKIFDPYFSTKDAKNGTGLGLYMSKIIVEDHHSGKLSMYNKDDGVCFKLELFDTSI